MKIGKTEITKNVKEMIFPNQLTVKAYSDFKTIFVRKPYDIIVKNIKSNINPNTKQCEVCGERFEYNTNCKTLPKYCSKCARKVKNQQIAEIMRKKRGLNNDL